MAGAATPSTSAAVSDVPPVSSRSGLIDEYPVPGTILVSAGECGSTLEVDRPIVRRQYALMHHFAQCRVREHRFHQLVLGRLQLAGDDIALDQLGDFGADHVRAEQFAGLGIEHRLDEAFRLAERDRLAVADKGNLPAFTS